MQHLEVSGAVRPLKWPLGFKWLIIYLDVQIQKNALVKFYIEAFKGSQHLLIKGKR